MMKTIARLLNKKIFFTILLFFVALPCVAQHALPMFNQQGEWGLGLSAGFLNGEVKEYVYLGDYRLSQLNWDIDTLSYTGFRFSYVIEPGKKINFGIWINTLAGNSGVMEDFDWAQESGGVYLKNGVWTHFSHHNNRIKYALFSDLNYSAGITGSSSFQFDWLAGLKLYTLKLEASDGYTQYSTSGTPPPNEVAQTPFYGLGVTYSLNYLTPYLGGMLWFKGNSFFNARLTALFSHFVFARCVDDHVARKIEFTDDIFFGRYLYLGLDLAFMFSPKVTFVVGWNWTLYPEWRSRTYINDYSPGGASGVSRDSEGATSVNVMGLTASVEISL